MLCTSRLFSTTSEEWLSCIPVVSSANNPLSATCNTSPACTPLSAGERRDCVASAVSNTSDSRGEVARVGPLICRVAGVSRPLRSDGDGWTRACRTPGLACVLVGQMRGLCIDAAGDAAVRRKVGRSSDEGAVMWSSNNWRLRQLKHRPCPLPSRCDLAIPTVENLDSTPREPAQESDERRLVVTVTPLACAGCSKAQHPFRTRARALPTPLRSQIHLSAA